MSRKNFSQCARFKAFAVILAMMLVAMFGAFLAVPEAASAENTTYAVKFGTGTPVEPIGNPPVVKAYVMGGTYKLQQTKGAYDPKTDTYAPADANLGGDGVTFTMSKDADFSTIFPATCNASFVPDLNDANGNTGWLSLQLPEGLYTITEVKRAPGYAKWQSDVKFNVPETNEDGTGYVDPIAVLPKMSKIKGSIKLQKTDADDATPIQGAQYVLQVKNGNDYANFAVEKQPVLSTDANGEILIEDIPEGKYRLVETYAPDTHLRDPQPIEFEIYNDETNGPSIKSPTGDDHVEPIGKGTAISDTPHPLYDTNIKRPTVAKDINGEAGPYDSEDTAKIVNRNTWFTYNVTVDTKHLQDFKDFTVTDIVNDALVIDDTSFAASYTGSGTPTGSAPTEAFKDAFTFTKTGNTLTIKAAGALTKLPAWTNHYNYAGGFSKVTFSFKAKFPEGYVMPAGVKAIANTAKLEYTYKVDETGVDASAIEGYNPNSLLSESKDSNSVYARTRSGKIVITKKGENKNGAAELLEGVEFKLYNKEDVNLTTPLATVTTDSNGVATFANLDFGDYLIKETKTKAGYRLPTQAIAVTLSDDAHETTGLLQNVMNYIEVEYPLTGTTAMLLYAIAGIVLLGLGVMFYRRSKKQNQ